MVDSIASDVAEIGQISAVPTILRTMRASTGLRFTVIARVTPERWVACAVYDEIAFGLEAGGELDVATTLCGEVRDTRKPIIIEEASQDPDFCAHGTPKLYKFESYIAVPIFRRNGEYFGNICGLDPLPRKLRDGKTLATLELFSQLISSQLAAEEDRKSDQAELAAQRQTAQRREQFIATLGHDIRNPLSSILVGADLLLRRATEDRDKRTLERIRSSSRRILSLVEDLLDLARGRLTDGIEAKLLPSSALVERLRHVVEEVQATHPARTIRLDVTGSGEVRCDERRIEQCLSNLLTNAIDHGAAGAPIDVSIRLERGALSLAVANEGEPIPPENLPHLFEPYFRGGKSGPRTGLGLGLYIVSEIAKAHGATLVVDSTPAKTVFRFTITSS